MLTAPRRPNRLEKRQGWLEVEDKAGEAALIVSSSESLLPVDLVKPVEDYRTAAARKTMPVCCVHVELLAEHS